MNRTVPYGTPDLTGDQLENEPLTTLATIGKEIFKPKLEVTTDSIVISLTKQLSVVWD